jgi:signal peptidase II
VTPSEMTDATESSELSPRGKTPSTTRQRAVLFWVAGFVLLLDQLSKNLIEAYLPLYQSWAPSESIAPYFRLTHTSNTGIAFGLLPTGSSFFIWTSAIVALAIVIYNYGLSAEEGKLRLALGLQLAGALGNLVDRLRLGHVTDFLDFGPWPVFNLADLSVVTGALLLGWLLWREEQQLRSAGKAPVTGQSESERPEISEEAGILDEWSAN